jgi:hypothetical protein
MYYAVLWCIMLVLCVGKGWEEEGERGGGGGDGLFRRGFTILFALCVYVACIMARRGPEGYHYVGVLIGPPVFRSGPLRRSCPCCTMMATVVTDTGGENPEGRKIIFKKIRGGGCLCVWGFCRLACSL